MKAATRRPFRVWVLVIITLFLGVAAIISGAMLFLSPDGEMMGMPLSALEGSPFNDYLVPGIILFVCNGVFPIFTGIGQLRRPVWAWPDVFNPFKNHHWAWAASLATGVILLIWIITETVLLGYISFLQPLMGGWGIVIIGLALLPPVRNYFRKPVQKQGNL